MRKRAQKSKCQADSEDARCNADQQGFREQLPDDSHASCSESKTHAEFAHAVRCTGQQQAGCVAAGYQQDDDNGAEEQAHQGTDMANGAVDKVLDGCTPAAHSRIVQLKLFKRVKGEKKPRMK